MPHTISLFPPFLLGAPSPASPASSLPGLPHLAPSTTCRPTGDSRPPAIPVDAQLPTAFYPRVSIASAKASRSQIIVLDASSALAMVYPWRWSGRSGRLSHCPGRPSYLSGLQRDDVTFPPFNKGEHVFAPHR